MADGRSMLGVCAVLFASMAVSCASKPSMPDNLFCYTTAGGVAGTGGSIKPGRCGETCGSKTDSTQWIGWVGVVVAVLTYGSNYVPVKKFDTGDGMFFQWVFCMGIWMVGLVANMIREQPPFFLPSLIAGLAWSVGNVLVVPIVKTVGLAMGLTLWTTTSILGGWVTGVFIFDQEVRCAPLNYTGVIIVMSCIIILLFVRSDGKSERGTNNGRIQSGETMLLQDSIDTLLRNKPREDSDQSWEERLGVWPRRVIGVSLALLAGSIFGFQYVPIEYLKLCDDAEHSCEDLDYLFGYYTGIMVGSTVFLAVYSVYMNNKPRLYPRVILPGISAGVLWGIGSVGLFLANKHLSLSISIPFIATGAQFVSAAWGILLFKEIKGWRHILLYSIALALSVVGLLMDGLSRCAVDCLFGLHTSTTNDSTFYF